jgi:hypothetical protein
MDVFGYNNRRPAVDNPVGAYNDNDEPVGGGTVPAPKRSRLDLHEVVRAVPHDVGRVDLGPIVRGEQRRIEPAIVHRDDGQGILYPGSLHTAIGEPTAGKTWIGNHAGVAALKAGGTFVMLDYESSDAVFVDRMRTLGITDDVLADPARVAYHNIAGKLTEARVAQLIDQCTAMDATLIVLDAMLPALTRQGLDDNSNADVADYMELVLRPLANTGAAVLVLDHVTKDAASRSRGPRGAGSKLQLVDVSYTLKVIKSFSRERAGLLRLVCEKDRFGTYCIGETVADIHVTPNIDVLDIELRTPRDKDAPFRPTRIMEHLSRALEEHGELNTNSLRIASRGDDKTKPLALELLVNEGYVELRKDGQAKLYSSIRAYRESTEGDRG